MIAHAEWPSLPGALAGGGVAALFALIVGWPLMRLSGVSASIATFAVLVVTYIVLGNWTAVTGGQNSLMGLPAYVDLWTALGWAIAAIVIAFAYQETRSALQLRASREDEAAAQASGVDVVRAPSDRLCHFGVPVGHRRRAAGAFPRHRPGREFLSRSDFSDRRDADHRRPWQPDRRGRRRRGHRGADRIAASDRDRRADRQSDDRRAARRRRRHPRADHAADHSVPAERTGRRAGADLAVQKHASSASNNT